MFPMSMNYIYVLCLWATYTSYVCELYIRLMSMSYMYVLYLRPIYTSYGLYICPMSTSYIYVLCLWDIYTSYVYELHVLCFELYILPMSVGYIYVLCLRAIYTSNVSAMQCNGEPRLIKPSVSSFRKPRGKEALHKSSGTLRHALRSVSHSVFQVRWDFW